MMRFKKRYLAPILAAALALFLGVAVGASAENFMRDADPKNKIAIRGCVIRFSDTNEQGKTVPTIHANSSHYCVGVTSVSVVDNGDIRIRSNTKGPIVSVAVSPDESFAQRGIDCGPSGGGGITNIRCYDRDGVKVRGDSEEIQGPWMNLWVTWFTWQDK